MTLALNDVQAVLLHACHEDVQVLKIQFPSIFNYCLFLLLNIAKLSQIVVNGPWWDGAYIFDRI